MRRALLFALLAGSLLLIGCGPPWMVVRQAAPNPLAGQRQLSLRPLSFEALRVGEKTEAEYLGGKDPASRDSWRDDLAAMTQIFHERLAGHAQPISIIMAAPGQPPSPFTVVPRVVFIEPGFYAGIVAAPSEVRLVLQILDGGGHVADEVHILVTVPADITRAASGDRLRYAADHLGLIAARYLHERTGI